MHFFSILAVFLELIFHQS